MIAALSAVACGDAKSLVSFGLSSRSRCWVAALSQTTKPESRNHPATPPLLKPHRIIRGPHILGQRADGNPVHACLGNGPHGIEIHAA
jgi:hypothetical protein